MYQNWSLYSGLIISLLQLNNIPFILYSRWKFPWLHRRRGSWCSLWTCVYICMCACCRKKQECWGLMRHPYERWGYLLINILIRHWLSRKCLVFLVFGDMDSPSLPLVFGFLSFIQAEESYQKKKKKKLSVLVRGNCQKGKTCSWKISKLLAFCLLRSMWRKWCWGSRCLFWWLGFIECLVFLIVEKKGYLGSRGLSRND